MVAPVRALAPIALALTACVPAAPPPAALPPPAPTSAPASPAPAPAFTDPETGWAFADPARLAKLRSAFPEIDAVGAEQLAKQKLPSLSIGVVIDGELAYVKGFGYADLEKKTPVDADTVYRIGSITKSFTGLTLLALRDEGALAIDEPLTRFVPEAAGLVYPTRDSPPISLRQLLAHTSGLPRMGGFAPHHGPSEDDVTRSLAGFALATPPGTRWSYSNLGYSLLGIAASRAAHTPYRELVGKRLLAPLGMTSTAWNAADLPAGRAATGYTSDGGGAPKVAEPAKLGAAEGAGGLYASTRDLARWIAFQLAAYPPRSAPDDGPVKRSTVREAHSTGVASGLWVRLDPAPQKGDKPVDAIAETYGFGWIAATTCDFDPMVWHNGGIDGFRSEVRFLPKEGVGVITLANSAEADMEAIAGRVLGALSKTGGLAPRMPKLAPAFGAAVEKLLGVLNVWDQPAYHAMLTKGRSAFPKEKDELAGYRERHAPCKGWKATEIQEPTRAKLSLDCARGALDMSVALGPDGLVAGFDGTSRDVPIPADERRIGEAVAKLIGAWDEGLYKKHLSRAFPQHDEVVAFYEGVRRKHGKCAVRSAEHAAFDRTILLACERGRDLRLSVTLDAKDPSVVRGYKLRTAPAGGRCPGP
jgi:CubicO group peptidase (beta-lactamase class C family)